MIRVAKLAGGRSWRVHCDRTGSHRGVAVCLSVSAFLSASVPVIAVPFYLRVPYPILCAHALALGRDHRFLFLPLHTLYDADSRARVCTPARHTCADTRTLSLDFKTAHIHLSAFEFFRRIRSFSLSYIYASKFDPAPMHRITSRTAVPA